MRRFFLILIPFILIFISCKEKNVDIRFSGEGKFSHVALAKMIDEPEILNPPEQKKSKSSKKQVSEPAPEPRPADFYGIDQEEMGNIIKSFGDCEGSGSTVFSVDLNGLSIKRIYLRKGSEFFFHFSAENVLHEKIFETIEKMKAENPALVVTSSEDSKSFSVYCKFPEDYVMFDSEEEGEEIKLSDLSSSSSKNDNFKVSLKNGCLTIIGDDKDLGAYIKFVIEMLKEK